jgi:hypothetical protein
MLRLFNADGEENFQRRIGIGLDQGCDGGSSEAGFLEFRVDFSAWPVGPRSAPASSRHTDQRWWRWCLAAPSFRLLSGALLSPFSLRLGDAAGYIGRNIPPACQLEARAERNGRMRGVCFRCSVMRQCYIKPAQKPIKSTTSFGVKELFASGYARG